MANNNCSQFNFESVNCTKVNIGFDYSKVLTFKDNSGKVINLTGFVLDGNIKDTLGGSIILALPEVGDDQTTGLYIPDRTLGVINLQIKKADTAISAASYPYEIVITNPSTDDKVFMQGTIQFFDRGF